MQALIKGVGGTIEAHFLDGTVTSCTVSLYTGEGASKVSAASATVDTVSTTTVGASSEGDTSLVVSSASGIATGRRYLVGTMNSTEVAEAVTVKSVASSTVTLWRPLMFDHATGAGFKGTRVSYAVSSTNADTLWFGGYADFTPSSGDVQTETVNCVLRKIAETLIDVTDLAGIFPKFYKMLDVDLDIALALRAARNRFLRELGGKFQVHCMLGMEHFREPCAMRFFLDQRHAFGSDWREVMDGLQRDYDVELQKLKALVPTDNDQDGTTTGANDGAFTSIILQRA